MEKITEQEVNLRELAKQWAGWPRDGPLPPSPGMARLIATYNRNKARRLAREAARSPLVDPEC